MIGFFVQPLQGLAKPIMGLCCHRFSPRPIDENRLSGPWNQRGLAYSRLYKKEMGARHYANPID